MEYSEEVRRRFAAPGNGQDSASSPGQPMSGEAQDRALGVWARFQMKAEAGRIDTVGFQVFGCPHTIAAASLLAELLEGEPLAALEAAWAGQLASRLQVPEDKLGRLLVLEDALRACAGAKRQGT